MSIVLTTLLAASLFIPETNEKTIETVPLTRGETAFVATEHGANVKIGSSEFKPLDVYDKTALRGFRYYSLDRADMSVLCSSNLTYSAAADSWSISSVDTNETYTLYVYFPNDKEAVTFEATSAVDLDLISGYLTMEYEIKGNVVTAKFYTKDAMNHGHAARIKDLVLTIHDYGEKDFENDLTDATFNITDDMGSYNLGNLRTWASHLYDGNRGADWSKYDATCHTHIGNNHFIFGAIGQRSQLFDFGVDDANTNAVVARVGGLDAAKFYMDGGTTFSNGESLMITNFTLVSGNYRVGIAASNMVFDVAKLRLMNTDALDASKRLWRNLSYSVISADTAGCVVAFPTNRVSHYLYADYNTSEPIMEVLGKLKVDYSKLTDGTNNIYQLISNIVHSVTGQ